MPRSITALAGEEKKSQQIPVSLIYLDIPSPSGQLAINDIDINLYLNRSTGALSITPGSGYDLFAPFADLQVPTIQISHETVLNDVSFTASNIDETWYSILYANAYTDAPVTIWQANLSLNVGDAPEQVTAVGAVQVYSGRIDQITANHRKATIHLAPHVTAWTMTIPYRLFSPQEFKFLPPPNRKLNWGFTEKTV